VGATIIEEHYYAHTAQKLLLQKYRGKKEELPRKRGGRFKEPPPSLGAPIKDDTARHEREKRETTRRVNQTGRTAPNTEGKAQGNITGGRHRPHTRGKHDPSTNEKAQKKMQAQ